MRKLLMSRVANSDWLIIMALELTEEPVEPKTILIDDSNKFVEYLEGAKHVQRVY